MNTATTVLITGGAGFIGSHLAERLIADGRNVVVLDNLSTGSLDNLSRLLDHPRLEFVQGSVLDRDLTGRLVQSSDAVVHLAAAVGVRYILDNPLQTIKTNVDGADIVLEAAARWGRKTLLASTSEVYGKNDADSLCESADSVLGPAAISRWSYATAKKLDEFLALAYAQTYGMPVVVTRFFNIVGPRQRSRYGMVLPNFVRAALAGDPIRVFGDGSQTRNLTFIADCVEALVLLLDSSAVRNQILNIGGPHETSILELAERVKLLSGSSSRIVRVPYEEAYPEGGFEDMRRRVPCICNIQRLTGWTPLTSIDQMILATVRHHRRAPRTPRGRPAVPSVLDSTEQIEHTQFCRASGGQGIPTCGLKRKILERRVFRLRARLRPNPNGGPSTSKKGGAALL